jgi:N-acetylmuramoyl-L-alanine amidase
VEKSEKKLLIDFKDTETSEDLPPDIILTKPGIEKIVVIPLPNGSMRVELSIAENVETKVFHIARIQDKPYRIVIDIQFPDVEKREGQEREQVKVLGKEKIIIIDPGPGGEDPGAIGKRGTQEKKVVLDISRKLKNILNKKKGYRAFLTRNGDYYVPFKKRMAIAREYGADLFISIHADAFRSRGASGSSVYCLSLRGASSEAAKILARNENLADIIGGSPNGESSYELDPIILNMFQTNTINSSKIFGSTVLKHLDRVNHVKFTSVQEAPFIVLKLPEIPSLLVETAYISNPREEKMLRNSRFQTDIAKALANSISEFLPLKPVRPSRAPTVVLTKREDKNILPDKEQRPHREEALAAGQSLPQETKVQTVDADATKPETTVYLVRKGDTLEMIASKHNTKIVTLLKLNDMKLDDTLSEGRILQVPAAKKDIVGEKKDMDVQPPRDRVETASKIPTSDVVIGEKKKDEKDTTPPVRVESSSAKPAMAVTHYKVRRGDSLDKIAKKHNTTISTLLKLNNMKLKEPLYVGRLVRVSEREKDITRVKKDTEAEAASTGMESSSAKGVHAVAVYTVKRGDSLDTIAKKHNTTIGALLKLNSMKMEDPLYVGRLVKVSEREKDITRVKRRDTETEAASTGMESSSAKGVHAVAVYKVKRGDSLDTIAKKYNTTISTLLKLNNMKLSETLYVGRKLKIPDKGTINDKEKKSVVTKAAKTYIYKVRKGDTLDVIARRCKTSVSEVRKLNKIKRHDVLYVNQKLKLPSNPTL